MKPRVPRDEEKKIRNKKYRRIKRIRVPVGGCVPKDAVPAGTLFHCRARTVDTILLCTGKNLTFKNCNLSTASLIKNTIDSTILDICDVKGTIFINIEKDHVHFVETNPDGIVTMTE